MANSHIPSWAMSFILSYWEGLKATLTPAFETLKKLPLWADDLDSGSQPF